MKYEVVYEYADPWPDGAPVRIGEPNAVYEISTSPVQVQREANSFLAGYVTMMARAGQPRLIMGKQPQWQVPVILRLPAIGDAGLLGMLEVDPQTGQVVTPTSETVAHMQELAHAIAAHFTRHPAEAV